MSYQVIARKWRPQSFTDVVGQNHITQTLSNALKNGRLPHALLFTGPRGTGKTSSARILAKALRCPNAVNFTPCNECDSCKEIATGNSVDVMEIDGASNNGVDSIRELRETVMFMPTSGKYKIYIIDEVHMLSTSAFNALLKTLEEPPSHVIFIMATTEVHKIPQTILSRCQRFDFRRISTRQITERLKLICDQDGVTADEDALWVIARQGDGSMRDSQSLLDQVITFANGPLTRANVVEILGLTDRALLFETLDALVERNTQGIIGVIEKIAQAGFEPHLFSQDLLEMIRNLLLVKVSGNQVDQILEMPDSEMNALNDMSQKLSEEDIHLLFDMALKGGSDIPRAQDPRIVLEVVLLRMASAPKLTDLKSLLQGGAGVQTVSAGGARPYVPPVALPVKGHQRLQEAQKVAEVPQGLEKMKSVMEAPKPKAASTSVAASIPAPQEVQTAPAEPIVAAPKVATGNTPSEKWVSFVELLRQDDALFAAKIENLLFVKEEGKLLTFGVPPKLAFLKDQMSDTQVRKKLQGFIDSYWAAGYSFEVLMNRDQVGESAQSLQQKKVQLAEDEIRTRIETNPMVKTAQEVFKGQIKSVVELKTDSNQSSKR
ncbi:DNA polymerase III subunit gamma/tau [Bdellovibrio svalbardensis]|uniref:DNA polymerase III subunit gamma/tau n=1 Tax=Bdellovibrio svalbardensis TaxID=2972972 RepID=A0ABT6DE52_9BACT|nr:DNA polymerase III subunit gamma/tau [Bdellovibrio svalbardensis]MDG0815115.1 DNA polymerase III subunit gamma/tau [Bdellovibrio svalbardensis]